MLKHVLFEGAELRMLEVRHAEAIYELVDRNREHLREWLMFVDLYKSADDALAFIQIARDQFASNQGTHYGIFYRGEFAGAIGYHKIDWNNRMTSIGYWLGKEFTGLGLMSAATRALVDQAIYEYGLNRVEIRVATSNLKSQAIPERLGFTKEGVVRQSEWMHDRFLDHQLYSMLASEWKGR